jgi:hypothetical protein
VYSCAAASASIAPLAITSRFQAAASGLPSASSHNSAVPTASSSTTDGGAMKSRDSNA